MVGLLLPVVVASLAAALRVGSFAGVRRLHIRGWPWALLALAIQLLLFNPPIDRQAWAITYGPWIWLATLVVLVAVLVRNAIWGDQARAAFGLAALGVALNLFVVAANAGSMPQSARARLAARPTTNSLVQSAPQLRSTVPSGPDTRFVWLGDVIPEPNWLPRANVVSIGDLLLSAAMAWWAYQVIATRRSGPDQAEGRRGAGSSSRANGRFSQGECL